MDIDCTFARSAPQDRAGRNVYVAAQMPIEQCAENGVFLLVGIITYDAREDRHRLMMTRAWEQRLSKGWPKREETPNPGDRRIIELLAKGAGSKQIARVLSSNSCSAGRKIKKVLEGLGVGSRAEAVVLATRRKWICQE